MINYSSDYKFHNDGTLSSIFSPEDKKTLASLLVNLHEHAPVLAEKITRFLDLPAITPEMRTTFERIVHEENAKNEKISDLTSDPVEYSAGGFDQNRTMGTLQGEYALTEAGQPVSLLGSFGAGPCVIVFIRAEHFNNGVNLSRGGVAHVDALTDVRSLEKIFDAMPQGAPIDVHLVSGEASANTLIALSDFLREQKNVRSIKSDVKNGIYAAVLDIETGKVYAAAPTNSGPDVSARMTIAGLKISPQPLRESFSGIPENLKPETQPSRRIIDAATGGLKRK